MDKTNSNTTKCSSKSWSYNKTTDAETINKKTSHKGNTTKHPCPYCKSWLNSTSEFEQGRIDKTPLSHGTPSPGNKNFSNVKIEASSAVCSPHLKYGIFNQKKITVNPRSVERPKSPMKQRFRSVEMDDKDTVSEPGSPLFSIRALSEQDRDKFTPLQTKGGDMATRL